MINIYSREEIDKIRKACSLIPAIFRNIRDMIQPGIQTKELNDIIESLIREGNAEPAFLGYRGFPAASCISVNETVVHGIPGDRRIREGDIVSIDIGIYRDGFYGDAAFTYPVGRIGREKERLIAITRKALDEGIKKAVAGNRISDISAVIEDVVTAEKCSPVRELVGHGVGRMLHEEPQIPNYRSQGTEYRIKEGMVMAIEPMINLGTYEVETLDDQWTVVTKDRKSSAHFEHTVAIVNGRAEILTNE
ncbi:MAG: type I methionyl aminopeptidase [Candidatus Raymondbacteria bacterium RifOxyA12_full_50_37]|uniref:Methionine aminopeptidase n=1 Tax=Candidatus Raymondbacteria bacterium RIFOXYD12_FULL_49_13 TaxID=1817890 RepID=A0A1F7FDX4_UNCRA|nr:MAG: type I methionyl aminopeptidase [Candidatus Raymondbacteria bacterium RifOxyA12_full_50_37]OGJ94118.1 MAG: type I methionyl aminopeptidase [Candidatus Raymondbacteria bacterium RIFOXYA2_FULL_49_16]OGJ96842.1 MAG: type I methionyl aminopeptidase [Candidatus Raymondbacteria bacterium RifOxyC12_full_50_8]OGJ96963.1 MAG: type I methionyl aminopeptidase [Candidatus Raymondbacteria bacterium RIFOXYC2_FULL_50_21]OGK01515.1 MAG: type I methionyl aminopeptidase [Candidatus Raymondbacteria bacter